MTAWMSNEFGRPRPGVLCEGLAGGARSQSGSCPGLPGQGRPPGGTRQGFGGGGRKVQTEGANGSKLSQNAVTRECWVRALRVAVFGWGLALGWECARISPPDDRVTPGGGDILAEHPTDALSLLFPLRRTEAALVQEMSPKPLVRGQGGRAGSSPRAFDGNLNEEAGHVGEILSLC